MITQEVFKKAVTNLCEKRAVLHYGPDCKEITVIAQALDFLKIANKAKWLDSFSITICDQIYLSFIQGGTEIPLIEQLCVIIHELEHVQQWKDHPFFHLRYFTSRAHRLEYELEAMKCQMAAYWVLTGQPINISGMVTSLGSYYLDKNDLRAAKKALIVYQAQVAKKNVRSAWWLE